MSIFNPNEYIQRAKQMDCYELSEALRAAASSAFRQTEFGIYTKELQEKARLLDDDDLCDLFDNVCSRHQNGAIRALTPIMRKRGFIRSNGDRYNDQGSAD